MTEPADAKLTLELSVHAIERYRQRVRPSLWGPHLTTELTRVLHYGEVSTAPPPWLAQGTTRQGPYLTLGDIVFPLAIQQRPGHALAVTCLTRGSISPETGRRRDRRSRPHPRHTYRPAPDRVDRPCRRTYHHPDQEDT